LELYEQNQPANPEDNVLPTLDVHERIRRIRTEIGIAAATAEVIAWGGGSFLALMDSTSEMSDGGNWVSPAAASITLGVAALYAFRKNFK
jgi:hypothetical protein